MLKEQQERNIIMAKGSRGGKRAGGGGGIKPEDIVAVRSLVSERERLQTEVDETMEAFKNVYEEYGLEIDDIQLATLKGSGQNALAYYDGMNNIAFNESYFNKAKMEAAYDACVKQGFHPSKGNKTALEAVAAHELGHALTNKIAAKMGVSSLKEASTNVVNEARKSTKHRGVVQMASKISGYATASNAEALAEAFADVYCNGKKARSESRAIVNTMKKYL